jgi:hypothetical protein
VSAREQCIRHRSQLAWRIADGKAVYVCYDIYDLPKSTSLPVPAGLRNSRSEFGIEIILILAFLHYWIGVSLDNARQIMNFFTGLSLSKGQADSLLHQLANDWDEQYGTIVTVLASLQTRISNFTLTNVLAEIDRWLEAGSSLFQQKLQAIHLTLPPPASTSQVKHSPPSCKITKDCSSLSEN